MIIHGVKEGQLKEELDLIKRIESILKLEDKDKKYLELLPFITEDYKGWNYLKQKNILNLQITELALENNPKSYQAWYHRLYVYKSNPKLLLNQIEREIKLISLLLKFDNRNFHCWNYKEGIRRLLELGMIESRDGGDDKGRVGDGGSGNEDGREGDGGSGNEDGREGDGGSGNEDGSEGDEDGSEGDEDGSEVSEGLKDDKVKESKDSKESKDRDSHTSPTTSPTLTPTTLTHTHLNSLNSIQYSISNYSFLHSFGNFNPCSAIFTDPYEDCVWFYFILKREEYLLRKGVYIRKYKNRLEIHFKKNYSGDLIFNLDKKEIKINIKYPTKIYKIGNNDNVNISMNNNNVVLNNIPLSLLKLFPSSPLKFNLLPDTLYFSNSLFLELKDLEPNCNLNYIFNLNQNEEFRELLKEKDLIRKKYYEEEDKYEIYC